MCEVQACILANGRVQLSAALSSTVGHSTAQYCTARHGIAHSTIGHRSTIHRITIRKHNNRTPYNATQLDKARNNSAQCPVTSVGDTLCWEHGTLRGGLHLFERNIGIGCRQVRMWKPTTLTALGAQTNYY
eukprot:gene6800-biopygen9685